MEKMYKKAERAKREYQVDDIIRDGDRKIIVVRDFNREGKFSGCKKCVYDSINPDDCKHLACTKAERIDGIGVHFEYYYHHPIRGAYVKKTDC